MTDKDGHLDAECPHCGKEELQVEIGEIGCDACECSWTWDELLQELKSESDQQANAFRLMLAGKRLDALEARLRIHNMEIENLKTGMRELIRRTPVRHPA